MNLKSPILLYRLSNWLWKKRVPIFPKLITLIIRFAYTCYLPHSATVGRDTVLAYGGMSVVVHGRARIGDGCHINQCVTIGGTSKKYGVPEIGNNVFIGAGAILLGPIVIGDNCVIAANSVVLSDIPANSLAAGAPAVVKKQNINAKDFI